MDGAYTSGLAESVSCRAVFAKTGRRELGVSEELGSPRHLLKAFVILLAFSENPEARLTPHETRA